MVSHKPIRGRPFNIQGVGGGGRVNLENKIVLIFSEKNKLWIFREKKIKLFTIWPIFTCTKWKKK